MEPIDYDARLNREDLLGVAHGAVLSVAGYGTDGWKKGRFVKKTNAEIDTAIAVLGRAIELLEKAKAKRRTRRTAKVAATEKVSAANAT